MAERSRPFAIGVTALVVLAVGAAVLLWSSGTAREASLAAGGAQARDPGSATAAERLPAVPPEAIASVAPLTAPEGAALSAPSRDAPAPAAGAPDGLDGPRWRDVHVAFTMRELGAMAPYVKVGLDAARLEMEFCFREAAAVRARAAPPIGDPDAEPSVPAVLLVYLEAREGAIDVVDARTEHLGTSTRELVDCCRDVLRGWEMSAFHSVPGRRYRVKYPLE